MDLLETSSREEATRHPWETVRADFFLRLLADAGLPAAGGRVLDVGAGDAWFAMRLAGASGGAAAITCWDVGYDSAAFSAPAAGVTFTATEPDAAFGLILAMDVMEHVEDDHGMMRRLVSQRLAAGGRLLLSVPAWPSLFSDHDRRLRHVRRYSRSSARRLLEDAGLSVLRSGGLFHTLLAPRWIEAGLERLGKRGAGHAGEWSAPEPVTQAVRAVLGADARLSAVLSRHGWDVPGLSWWALCRKP
jgi:SAM-dependent methyltransferase